MCGAFSFIHKYAFIRANVPVMFPGYLSQEWGRRG